MENEVYETRINNLLPTIYHLYESNGQRVCSISAKGWMNITSVFPLSTYARWERLDVYRDRIEFYQRSGWEEPVRGQFEIEFLNSDGADIEERAGVFLPRHIPVRTAVALESPLIWFSKIEIRRVWERRKSPLCAGYYQRVPTLRDVKTLRPPTELAWILGLMESQGVEPPPREEQQEEQPSEFEVMFENRREESVRVFADDGRLFFIVNPNQQLLLEAFDPEVMYSRYKKLIFKKNGEIDLELNRQWKPPWPLSIEVLIEKGTASEGITLAEKNINLYPGIPRLCEVWVTDPDHRFKKKTKREVVKEIRRGSYVEKVRVLEWVNELRPEKELRELNKQRADLLRQKAEEKIKASERQ